MRYTEAEVDTLESKMIAKSAGVAQKDQAIGVDVDIEATLPRLTTIKEMKSILNSLQRTTSSQQMLISSKSQPITSKSKPKQ